MKIRRKATNENDSSRTGRTTTASVPLGSRLAHLGRISRGISSCVTCAERTLRLRRMASVADSATASALDPDTWRYAPRRVPLLDHTVDPLELLDVGHDPTLHVLEARDRDEARGDEQLVVRELVLEVAQRLVNGIAVAEAPPSARYEESRTRNPCSHGGKFSRRLPSRKPRCTGAIVRRESRMVGFVGPQFEASVTRLRQRRSKSTDLAWRIYIVKSTD